MPQPDTLPPELSALVASVAALLPMRRGSVGERYQKCGKLSCACHRDPAARHGPYHAWTRVIDGKTHSRMLTAAQAELVRQQIASGAEFRAIIEQFWEAAERLADQAIAEPKPDQETAEKRGLCDELQAAVEAEVTKLISRGVADEFDFEATEMALRARVHRLAARALERQLGDDRTDYAGPHLACACGGTSRFAGRRSRTVVTVFGEVSIERAYYHCDVCDHGFCPRDRTLRIEDSHVSPGVLRMVGAVGACVSFAEGSALLKEIGGISVSPRQVERDAERLGEDTARFEREVFDAPTGAPVPTMYLGQDGTGVPMRKEELEGRSGKQADGSSKTREMKLVAIWTADDQDTQGRPTRDQGSITYTAAIESAETKDAAKDLAPFTQRVYREAVRRGYDHAVRKVAIGDGAPWLWNIVAEFFDDAIQILDKFHAKEHLHVVANEVFGPRTEAGRTWSAERCGEIDRGDADLLIAAVAVHAERFEEARKCVGYYTNNRHRMAYPTFEAMGLCVGSGVVEAGCKTAIGVRMKRAGMHWTLRGANAIAALRCCRVSGRYEEFWEWRAEQQLAA